MPWRRKINVPADPVLGRGSSSIQDVDSHTSTMENSDEIEGSDLSSTSLIVKPGNVLKINTVQKSCRFRLIKSVIYQVFHRNALCDCMSVRPSVCLSVFTITHERYDVE